ncbi:hypothetical protein KKH23_06840 [Patescibacteria group bacterium]|uniref:Uncharacterized protein n=1 Tax=viral metagenome TaxID=1070528 RepID=A0A6M3LSV0_9ZZZZ|nr:hypothetical protein [Patescibacteria group bacterium]MBU0846892.1 hypothetical protein [Patescibacteria group bacterium]
MRRVLVVEQIDKAAKDLAKELGCSEIARNVPRFEGYVKSLPSVVIESETNPGVILGAFPAANVPTLEDLPEPEKVKTLIEIVEALRQDVTKLGDRVKLLEPTKL